jgi:hypothetical protein
MLLNESECNVKQNQSASLVCFFFSTPFSVNLHDENLMLPLILLKHQHPNNNPDCFQNASKTLPALES